MVNTQSLAALLAVAATCTQAADPNSAPCHSLVSSISSCSAKSSNFYATVTDESAAIATASACLCTSAAAFETGISACDSYAKTSSVALSSALGMEINAEGVEEYLGFCRHSGSIKASVFLVTLFLMEQVG